MTLLRAPGAPGASTAAPDLRAPPARDLPRPVVVLAAALLLFAHVYVLDTQPHWFNPNQISRVHLTLALLSEHSLRIDPYLKMIDTEDKATHRGHFYTDKSPGSSLLLVPFGWLLSGSGPHDKLTDAEYRRLMYGMRILGISVPAVLFWLLGIRWYRVWAGTESRALALVLAGALGTNSLVYATHVFGVVPCAVTLFGAFLAARHARSRAQAAGFLRGPGLALLAGALAATSFVLDPLSGFALGVIGLYVVFGAGGPRVALARGAAYALGAAGPLGLWMAYNVACFGAPLDTGIHHLAETDWAARYNSGFLGFNAPTAEGWFGVWLSGRRGMLFLSPFLAFALVGWARMLRDRQDPEARTDAVASIGVTLAVTLFGLMTIDWTGGWSVGARYLVPCIPFVLVGVAAAMRPTGRDPRPDAGRDLSFLAIIGLAITSTLAVAISEVTFPAFPNPVTNPVGNLAWPLLASGCVTPAFRLDGSAAALVGCLAVHVELAVGLLLYLALRSPRRRAARAGVVVLFALLGWAPFALCKETINSPDEQRETLSHLRFVMDCRE